MTGEALLLASALAGLAVAKLALFMADYAPPRMARRRAAARNQPPANGQGFARPV